MPKTIIIDDSPLAAPVAFLCGVSAENVLRKQALLEQTLLERRNPVDRVLLHAAYGKGMRTVALGVELMVKLRRDLRFDGEILLYSIEPLPSLAARHSSLHCLESAEDGSWNISFFALPQEQSALQNAAAEPAARLSDEMFTDFLMRHGQLDSYFLSMWSNVAHWLQGDNWRARLQETNFRILLRNTKELGPLWRATRAGDASPTGPNVTTALDFLDALTNDSMTEDVIRVRNAVDTVQAWLTGAGTHVVTASPAQRSVPAMALRECSLVHIADDDGYDASGLEALGYSVRVNTRSPAEARACLDEEPHVFLCDLMWKESAKTGIELATAAVAKNVKVVILMSAGPLPAVALPPEIIPCAGWRNKSNANHLHSLIINAYKTRKQESQGGGE